MSESRRARARDGDTRPTPRKRTGADENGYALAVSLIVIVVVSLLATAGYSMSDFELNASRDFSAETEAFYLADRGLNKYMATLASDLEKDTTFQFANGTAAVAPEQVALGTGIQDNEELHRVTSTGTYVTPDGETVQRTVSTLLLATPMLPVYPNGAFVSGGKFHQNGSSATFDGNNQYPPTPNSTDPVCEAAGVQSGGSKPGIVADSLTASSKASGKSSSTGKCEDLKKGMVSPDPPGVECKNDPVDEFMSVEQWEYMMNEMPADHVVSGSDQLPSTDGWEVIRADGDYDPSGSGNTGKGILVVTGDFTSDGNFTWDGLLLVGGRFISNGKETIHGGVVTGLNSLLGANVPPTSIGNGNKDFVYNSCNVFKASRSKYRVSKVPSTWYELQ